MAHLFPILFWSSNNLSISDRLSSLSLIMAGFKWLYHLKLKYCQPLSALLPSSPAAWDFALQKLCNFAPFQPFALWSTLVFPDYFKDHAILLSYTSFTFCSHIFLSDMLPNIITKYQNKRYIAKWKIKEVFRDGWAKRVNLLTLFVPGCSPTLFIPNW